MSNPESTLRDILRCSIKSHLHTDAILVEIIPSSEWSSDALSEDSGGLTEIIWKLFMMERSSQHELPVLASGLLPEHVVEERVKRLNGRQLMLWQWPGFTYLPYGFSEQALLEAARKVIEGAKQPLPSGLLPKRDDILLISFGVRHWLENRRRNAESTREDFLRAARGEIPLHHLHLEPVMAISEGHQRMLGRLWALERAASQFSPATDGLGQMKMGLEEFTNRWVELEAKRAALRENAPTNDATRLTEMAEALDAVIQAIDRTIAASGALDAKLLTVEGK